MPRYAKAGMRVSPAKSGIAPCPSRAPWCFLSCHIVFICLAIFLLEFHTFTAGALEICQSLCVLTSWCSCFLYRCEENESSRKSPACGAAPGERMQHLQIPSWFMQMAILFSGIHPLSHHQHSRSGDHKWKLLPWYLEEVILLNKGGILSQPSVNN